MLLVSSHVLAEPQLAGGGKAVEQRLIDHLRAGALNCPGARVPDPMTERAAIGAASSLISASLVEGNAGCLRELRSNVTRIILEPYLEHEAVERVATID
jgi:hypothetical protein